MMTSASVSVSDQELDWAWSELKKCFGLEGEVMSCQSPSDEVIAVLEREGILQSTGEYLQSELNRRLRLDVVPAFWSSVFRDIKDPAEASHGFSSAVTDLYTRAAAQMAFVHKLSHLTKCHIFQQDSYQEMFKLMLQGTLHSQLPKNFETPVERFYSRAFHVFYVRQEKNQLRVKFGLTYRFRH